MGKATRLTATGFVKRFVERHVNRPDKPFCFVLGSGASKPSDIPTGEELVRRWLRELHEMHDHDGKTMDEWATALNLDIPRFDLANAANFYSELYARRFPQIDDGFAHLESLMAGKVPSFGYSVLAYLLSQTPHQVVITTNFDNLVATALSAHSSTFPRVVGHDELVRYVNAHMRRPLVAKIHGDLGFAPKNKPDEVATLSAGWCEALRRILTRFTPVFLGYGGNDGSLMNFLMDLEIGTPDTMFWCHRRSSAPHARIREVVDRHSGSFVEIAGFDEIMMQLLAEMPSAPDLVAQLERNTAKQVEAFKEQRQSLAVALASLSAPHSAARDAVAMRVGDSEAASISAAAGKVLASESSVKDWWQWQLEINAQASPEAVNLWYQKALEALPENSNLLGNYALFLKRVRKDMERAEEHYKRALEADPEHANNLGNYAVFLETIRKDMEAAEEHYKRALRVDPVHAANLGNYASFLQTVRKDMESAEEHYKRALEANPKDATNLGNYASFLVTVRKDIDGAEAHYKRSLEVDPRNADNLGNYASFLQTVRKDLEGAEMHYRRALESDPIGANNLGNFAGLLFSLSREREAEDYLGRAEESANDSRLKVELAFYRCAHLLGEWPSSLGALKRLIQVGARSPGWDLTRNVASAGRAGHPEPDLLRALAAVVSEDAPASDLAAFPTWCAA